MDNTSKILFVIIFLLLFGLLWAGTKTEEKVQELQAYIDELYEITDNTHKDINSFKSVVEDKDYDLENRIEYLEEY